MATLPPACQRISRAPGLNLTFVVSPHASAVPSLDPLQGFPMCNRYNLYTSDEDLIDARYRSLPPISFYPRWNIPPTTSITHVRVNSVDDIEWMDGPWGFKASWTKAPLTIARGDSVFEKKTFAKAARERRCLIPATDYIEWEEQGKEKLPWVCRSRDVPLIMFAGIYDTDGSIAIITTDENAELRHVIDRMPVVLPPDAWEFYLDPKVTEPEAIKPLFKPLPDGSLNVFRTSKYVNNARNKGPQCVEPLTTPDMLF